MGCEAVPEPVPTQGEAACRVGHCTGVQVAGSDQYFMADCQISQYKADHSNSAGSKPLSCLNCLSCRGDNAVSRKHMLCLFMIFMCCPPVYSAVVYSQVGDPAPDADVQGPGVQLASQPCLQDTRLHAEGDGGDRQLPRGAALPPGQSSYKYSNCLYFTLLLCNTIMTGYPVCGGRGEPELH